METDTLDKIEADLRNSFEVFTRARMLGETDVALDALTDLFNINKRMIEWLKMDRQIIDDFDEIGTTLSSYDLLDEESKDALDQNIIEQWERQQAARTNGEVLAYNEMDYIDLSESDYLAAKERVKARTEARKLIDDFTQDKG